MSQQKLDQETETKIIDSLEHTNNSYQEIANQFGVSEGTVGNIKRKHGIIRPLVSRKTKINKEIDPTDERILHLESKILSLTDERNSYKRAYEAAQRENSVFEELAKEVHTAIKPIKPLPKAPNIQSKIGKIQESLGLCLSDIHGDSIVMPHQVGGLERYDFNIALRRSEVLVDTALKFTQHTLCNYEFDTLYIFSGGDDTNGEIHDAVKYSSTGNIFRNCLAIGQMKALMIRDFARNFNNVKVVCVSGNHGRRTHKKEYQNPRNNFDYLISEIAAAYCRDMVNVEFIIPDSFSALVQVEGYGFLLFHGDDIKSYQGIPWYGLERKTRRLQTLSNLTDKAINYYILGHFHNRASMDIPMGETLINGAWLGTDPYSFNALSVYSEPKQLLFGIHKNNGVSWRLPIKLKSEDEHLGPKRYSIIMAK